MTQNQSPSGLQIPADWTFHNREVADNFDTHVREQLPWYDLATGMVAHFGRAFLPHNGVMLDFGASTGNITNALKHEIQSRSATAISYDNSKEMVEAWRGVGEIRTANLINLDIPAYDFGVCFLVLMFLPPTEQRNVFRRMYDKLNPGGALIVFDRTATFSGYLATTVNRLTLAGKMATGVSCEDIVRKELSLNGAQRPIDVNHMLFHQYGVAEVFRFGDFAGWVATK